MMSIRLHRLVFSGRPPQQSVARAGVEDRDLWQDRPGRQEGVVSERDDEAGRGEDPAEAFRRLDAQDRPTLPEQPDDEEVPSPWRRLGRQLVWLLVAMVGVGIFAFGAGWLYATIWGPGVARAVLSERVESEPETDGGLEPPIGADVAPTSGASTLEPHCGIESRPIDPEQQIATLRAGAVIVQYRLGEIDAGGRETIEEIAREHDSHVLVAPNPELQAAVEATAWQRRLRLDEVERATLRAFTEGYRRPRPEEGPCPVNGANTGE
jgi:hypothetical protein